jgi:hypothetical protein
MTMRSWIRNLFARRTPRTIRKTPDRLRLNLEALEDRLAPSVSASLTGSQLAVVLSAPDDQALITPSGANLSISGTDLTAQLFSGVATIVVSGANAPGQDVPNQGVTFGGNGGTITLHAAPGSDALNVSGVTLVQFTNVAINATSGNIDVVASEEAEAEETTSATFIKHADAAPQVVVSVTGASLAADDVRLNASAASKFTTAESLAGNLNSLGVAAVIADLEPSATVTVDGASNITAGGNVEIAADVGVEVESSIKAGTEIFGSAINPADAAIAESVIDSQAVAHVVGGSRVSGGAAGTLSITSTNTTTVTTEVEGVGVVGGATAAVTLDNSTSRAFVDGGANLSGGTVEVSALTANTAKTDASSTAKGAGGNAVINNFLEGKVDPAYVDAALPASEKPGHRTSPAETAATGGLPLSVAGALAVTKFTPTTEAYVDSSHVTAANAIHIVSSANNSADTKADASTTTANANASVGVAVAIANTVASNTAWLGSTTGAASLSAPTIVVQAASPPATAATPNSFISAVEALSGVSGSNVGAAGAVAINLVSNSNEAKVPWGSTVATAGDVTFNAQDSATESATARPPEREVGADASGVLGVGGSVALNVVSNSTRAELESNPNDTVAGRPGAQLTGAHNLTFSAGSTDVVTTEAAAGSKGGTLSISPSAAISVVTNTTAAQVGAADAANDPLIVSGAFSATATHTALTATLAGSSSGEGEAASAGISVALGLVTDLTTATTLRSLQSLGGGTAFEADNSAASLVSSSASADGGPTASEEASEPKSGPAPAGEAAPGSNTADPNSVDGQNAQQRDFAHRQGGALTDSRGKSVSAGDTSKKAATPAAKTSDGSITVAAAVAVNIVDSEALAIIPAGVTITAAGPLTVTANNDTGDPANPIFDPIQASPGDTANAWGTDVGEAGIGIGTAVALNLVKATTQAEIQSTAAQPTTVHAQEVTLNAGMLGNNPMNSFGALATSAAAAGDIGVAGSVAINIVDNSSNAVIQTGAVVAAGGGDVSVTSLNNASDMALALPGGNPTGDNLGAGGSLALNIVSDVTQSEVQDGAALTDAGNVTVTAASSHAFNTWAQNGGESSLGLGGGVAIVLANAPTTARIGADPATLDASGDLTIGTSGSFAVNTLADATTAPSGKVGLGASVVVNVSNDSFLAELARNVAAGGAVSITADGTSSSQATAVASTEGADPKGTDSSTGSSGTADQETQNQSSYAHDQAGSNANPSGSKVGAPPRANDEVSSPGSKAKSKSGGSEGATKIGIAAAVAVNVLTTSTVATIDNGLTVTAGGALTVGTTNQSGALALGDGRSTTNQNSIGAGVSLNVANVTNSATIGAGDVIRAGDVSVAALMPSGAVNDFSTQGVGVAIGSQAGIAGSAGINVIAINTQASIGAGARATSSGGLTVQAANDETFQDIAFTVASGKNVGAGASINVNVLNNSTNAFIDTGAQANAAGMTQVTSASSVNPSQDPFPNSPAESIIATGNLEEGNNEVTSLDGTIDNILGRTGNTPKDGEFVTGDGIPLGAFITKTESGSFEGELTFGSDEIISNDPQFNPLSLLFDFRHPLKVGETISGPGIPGGATIVSASWNVATGETIKISAPVYATGSATLGRSSLKLSSNATTSGPVVIVATVEDAVDKAISTVHPTNFAAGAAGSSNGAAVAGSFIVDVINQTTHAFINNGAAVNTLIGTPGYPTAQADQGVTVAATETMKIVDWAGGIGGGSDVGIGAALDVNIVTEDDQAYIASGATVVAAQNVVVLADTNGNFQSITAAAGFSEDVSIAGAASVEILSATTNAFIDQSATVTAQGDVVVQASREATIDTTAGQLTASSEASVGASVSTVVDTVNTNAAIGANAHVTAQGISGPLSVLVGDVPGDTTPFAGLAVVAATFQDMQSIVLGGSASAGNDAAASVAGSIAVNVLNDTTMAYIAPGAVVNATANLPGTGPGVMVAADDRLTLLSTAGTLAFGISATPNIGVGVGADIDSITRNTQAFVAAANVTADGNVLVQAQSSENLTSITASVAVSLNLDPETLFISGAVSGSLGVYVLNVSTEAYLGDNATVHAGGSVLVAASEATALNLLSGSIAASFATIGAAATVPVITKTTEAFVGAGAHVDALGLGNPIQAETGQFAISYQNYGSAPGDVKPMSESANLTGNGNSLTGPRLGQQRVATPMTTPVHGLAVTAVNADNLQGVGFDGGAGAGAASLSVNGAIGVITNHTAASIGSGAAINSNNAGAASGQSVLVAAGNDASFLGIAAAASVASLAAAPGVVLLVVNNTTTASIDDGASVAARGDVAAVAHSSGDVLTIAAGIALGNQGAIGGSVSYVGFNDTTVANIGDAATTAAAGAQVNAGGNVLVDATDDTAAYMITGGISVAQTGPAVGGSVSIVNLSKNTDAFLGSFATVNAQGNTASLPGVFDGNYTASGAFETLASFHGVAVQAATSENVTNVAAAGAAGDFAGLAGGVSIELFHSTTRADVGNNAQVNTNAPGANAAQSVDVAAVNRASNFSFAGGLAAGQAGISGAVDVGFLQNSTQAYIGNGADVQARKDVNVYALSNDAVQTYALGAAVGIDLGAVGSVSVWSIGAPYSPGYTDGNAKDGTVTSVPASGVIRTSSGAEGETAGGSDLVALLNNPNITANTTTTTPTPQYISGDPVAQSLATAAPTGTVAFIGSSVSVSAGADVNVRAKSEVSYTGIVGGLAAGAVGIGGSVAIANIQGNTQAYIDANSTVSAGGTVAVDADLVKDTSNGTAFAGTAGIFAIGAQVIDIQDSSTESATLNSGVKVLQAQQVQVSAEANRSLTALAVGGNISLGQGFGFAAGVGVAIANAGGSATAGIGSSVQIGVGTAVGGVSVAAVSTDSVKAQAYGVSAGETAAATGVFADAEATPTAAASIGDNAAIAATGPVTVTAEDTPTTSAQALGVAVAGGVGLGAAVSQAHAGGTTSSTLGNGVVIAAGSLQVEADRSPAAGRPTAWASSTAGTGGILVGVNATISTATSDGNVLATTGTANLLVGGDITVAAANTSDQSANAFGIAAGALALGLDIANANANVSTQARLLAGPQHIIAAGTINVTATGTDENDANSTAGSGGVIAGDAAIGNTNDASTVAAEVGGTLAADTVNVSATNNSVFMPQVDSVNAAILGASGAVANSSAAIAATATVDASTMLAASSAVNVTAHNSFTEKLPAGGSNVAAGGGGIYSGAAAASHTTLLGNADVIIGGGVGIAVEAPASPASGRLGIFLTASSSLTTGDKVTLSTGGALAGGGTDSNLAATLNNKVETDSSAASPDNFVTNQNIAIGTSTAVNAANISEAHTFGVVGTLASASAEMNVTSTQTVTLGPDTNLTAALNIALTAGDDPTLGANTAAPFAGTTDAQSFARGFVGVPVANATTNLTNQANLTVGANDQIRSGENITLAADTGAPAATAQGVGHGLEVFLIPVTDGSSSTSTNTPSSLTVNGTVTAGIYHELNITIPDAQNASANGVSGFYSDASALVVNPDGAPHAAFAASFDPNFNPVTTIQNAANAGAFPDPGEATALEDATYNGEVGALVLGPLFAAGGDVTVNAGTLQGNGTITAYGGPTITVTNNSPDYLVLGSINIPDQPGGQVVYTGAATAAPASLHITQSGSGARPVVNIQELYDQSVPSSSTNGPSVFLTAAVDGQGNVTLDPSGSVNNEAGQVAITVVDGSLVEAGSLNANQVTISVAKGIYAVSNPAGVASPGGTPSTGWDSTMFWPDAYNPYASGAAPSNLARDYVAYVANAMYNNPTLGTTNSSAVFTHELLGFAGENPLSITPGSFSNYGFPNPAQGIVLFSGTGFREPATSLVFFGADLPWNDGGVTLNDGGVTLQDTNASASAASPANTYYQSSPSANDGFGPDFAEGIFPAVPVKVLPVTTASYPTISGSLTSGSTAVTVLGSTPALAAGDLVRGTGIQPGTTIQQFSRFNFAGFVFAGSTEISNVFSPSGTLELGATVTGPGIAPGTTIQVILSSPQGTNIFLSAPATVSGFLSLTATSLTLSAPATVTGTESLAFAHASSLTAQEVFINARYVDINAPLNVGQSNNLSVSIPASLNSIIAQDQANFAQHIYSTTAGDAPGFYTLPASTISAGDRLIPVQFDANTNQIVVSGVSGSFGGFLKIEGAIMSTTTFGEINESSDLGQVTIDNQTNYAIRVNDVSASKSTTSPALSGIDIIDTNQPAATQQKLYVYQPGNVIDEYQGTADLSVQQLEQGSPVVIQGNSTTYSPETGLRWEWQLQATMQQPNLNPSVITSAGWVFDTTDVSGVTSANPWYYLEVQNGHVANGTTQPTGWLVVNGGLPDFQETIDGTVTNSISESIYHVDNHYQFAEFDHSGIDPWTYIYATQAELTLTNSVKADNPIGLHFSGASHASVNINSPHAAVILAGNIANPLGDTTITAPSITQQAAATITSNNLTLTATVGGVGTATQPVQASLTAGGVLKVTGVGSVYLHLDSGALLDNIQTDLGGGDVVIKATGSLAPASGLTSILGNNITLSSAAGSVGTAAAPLTLFAEGVVNVSALGDIGLVQGSFAGFGGDLKVGQIVSTQGDVTISVPGGQILNADGTAWANVVNDQQSQQAWQDLSLTNPSAAQQQAVTSFQNEVNAEYQAYWQLLDNGSAPGGVFTLNVQGLALYRGQAGQAQNPPIDNPTDVQVQAYASSLYQGYVAFFNQNLDPNWMTSPDFQVFNPAYNYVATPQQVSDLQKNAVWTTPQLTNAIARVAVNPQDGNVAGITTPNISGANVTLASSQSIGQAGSSPTFISLADLKAGVALPEGTAPADVLEVGTVGTNTITVPFGQEPAGFTFTGVEITPHAQLFISATGTLKLTATGSVVILSTAQNVTLGQVTAGGEVNIAAPGSIFSDGSAGSGIATPGDLVLKVDTGTVGSPATRLNVGGVKGSVSVYTPPSGAYLTGAAVIASVTHPAAVEGISTGTVTVAAFTYDLDISNLGATITWADGQATAGTIVATGTPGSYKVTGSHTYAEEITTPSHFTVTINDSTRPPVTRTINTATVADAGLTITSITHPVAAEGIGTGTVTVATFTDAAGTSSDSGDLSATITWADGQTSAGTVVATGTPGGYAVTGSHTYNEEISTAASFTVTVKDSGGAAASRTITTATVADAGLTITSVTHPAAAEGIGTGTVTVATFTDAAGVYSDINDLNATITWADGSTSAGTVVATSTPGSYAVTGSHTYAEEILTPMNFTVTVKDSGGSSASTTISTATVADAGLNVTSVTHPTAAEGIGTGTVTVATFTDAAGVYSDINDLNATITWADGSTSAGTVVATGTPGGYAVTGSHTYAEEITTAHNFTVTVKDSGGSSASKTISTATVADAPLSITAVTHPAAIEGVNTGAVTVATFTDAAGASSDSGDLSATITWADGQTSVGTVVATGTLGSYKVTGSHNYVEEIFTPSNFTVAVKDSGGSSASRTITTATVTDAIPVAGAITGPSSVIPGQQLTLSAGFTDTGILDPHTGTFVWGDGTSTTVNAVQTNGLAGTVTSTHIYAATGTYTVTLTVADDEGTTSAPVTFSVKVTQSAYLLNPSASGAFTASGNAIFNVPDSLVVDSSSSTALIASGNASVKANRIIVVGGDQVSTNVVLNPSPVLHGAGVTDPLAFLTAPGVTGSPVAVNLSSQQALTISPGIYSQIQVSGQASLTMLKGVYVIAGGGFSVSGSGSVTGNGVMIYNAGSNYSYNPTTGVVTDGGTYGSISLGGNGTFNLSAPASGQSYTGVILFQARGNTRGLSLSGNALSGTLGTIYAPTAAAGLSGNTQPKSTLVVSTLSVTGTTGAFQLTAGADSAYAVSTSNWIANGVLTVSVQDDTGNGLDASAVARLGDAMTYLDETLASYGVQLSWAAPGTTADVHVHFASSTPEGGVSDGVLGFTTPANDVYFVTGWNFSTSPNPSAVGANQYDFLTLATHELAHTVGLGESVDPASVMYEYLTPGTVRHTFTDSNLALINTNADRYMKVGTGFLAVPGAAAGPLPDATALAQAFASQEQGGGLQLLPRANHLGGVFGDWTHAGATSATLATVRASLLTDLAGSPLAPSPLGPSGTDGLCRGIPAGSSLNVLVGGDGDELQIGNQGTDDLVGGFSHHGPAGDAGVSDQGMGTEPVDLFSATEAVDLCFASA